MPPIEVRSAADWESAQESSDHFHDSVTRSLSFKNDQHVDPDGWMVMGHGNSTASVVVQTQNAGRPGGRLVESVRIGGRDLLRFVFGECEVVAAYATVDRPRKAARLRGQSRALAQPRVVPPVASVSVFERFTDRAGQVVILAEDESRRLRHNYIGTEHILLGLLREEQGLAARLLASLGITVDEVRMQVARIVGRSRLRRTTRRTGSTQSEVAEALVGRGAG